MSDYSEQESLRKKMRRQAILSMLIAIFFLIYNGFIGIYYKQIFPLSIAIYYVFLVIITAIVATRFRKGMTRNSIPLYLFTNFFLIGLDVALLVPIILIVFFQKPANVNPWFAIGYGAYALWKIIHACIGYKKNKNNRNIAYLELKTIKVIDAILSILSLENILIVICTKGNITQLWQLVSLVSGIVFVIIMIILTIASMVKGLKILKTVRA